MIESKGRRLNEAEVDNPPGRGVIDPLYGAVTNLKCCGHYYIPICTIRMFHACFLKLHFRLEDLHPELFLKISRCCVDE